MPKFKWSNHLCKQLVCTDRVICTFAFFHFFKSSVIEPLEVDTKYFSDYSLKNEIIKVKHVKPIQEKL